MIVQTPGVYIKEKSLLPGSVAGVSTAVPAFIGITELKPDNKPHRIKSMFEFQNLFGGTFEPNFTVNGSEVIPDRRYFLYDALLAYFTNGGGPCYIVSAEKYDNTDSANIVGALSAAIPLAGAIDEVTLMVMPDMHFQFNNGGALASLDLDYGTLASALVTESATRQDRFALLDYLNMNATSIDTRSAITATSGDLPYGAVYYPWLRNSAGYQVTFDQIGNLGTGHSIEQSLVDVINDINSLKTEYGNLYDMNGLRSEYQSLITDISTKAKFTEVFAFLMRLIKKLDGAFALTDTTINNYKNSLSDNVSFTDHVKFLYWVVEIIGVGSTPNMLSDQPINNLKLNDGWIATSVIPYTSYAALANDSSNLPAMTDPQDRDAIISDLNSGLYVDLNAIFAGIAGLFDTALSRKKILEDQLFANVAEYADARVAVENYMKQVPAQGAVAGVYCKNDRDRGVWKSPANMAVLGIERPLVEVSNQEQDNLNVDASTGKSINVIRTFTGKGPLVWGARTLDGNSNEWRYIAVRRFFNFAEESIKKSMNDFVFEPNNARTWVKIKAMVVSFLVQQWQQGALTGNSMDEAFFVRIGEDTTTEAEILAGKINVQIGMAVARPAEFIILEFSHYSKA